MAGRCPVLPQRGDGITETEHFFGTALAIEEINQAGGVLGRQIEAVAYDPDRTPTPTAAWPTGCSPRTAPRWCSAAALGRAQGVLPAMERHNGLLWYPSLYEGFEYSQNVIYTGATPNQNVFPLADYLLRDHGPRVFLIGSDYIYPRESNRVMRDLIKATGGKIVGELYAALDADDAPAR